MASRASLPRLPAQVAAVPRTRIWVAAARLGLGLTVAVRRVLG